MDNLGKVQSTTHSRLAFLSQEVKMLRINLAILLFIVTMPGIAVAADFYINFDSCKMLIGYLVLSNESLKRD